MFNNDYTIYRLLDNDIDKRTVIEFIEEKYGRKAYQKIDQNQTEQEIIKMIKDVSSYISELEANGLEEKVLKLKNPAISYYFAKFIVNASTNRHGEIIIESKDLYWNYKYALDIHTANVDKHAKVVLESDNRDFLEAFYRTVPCTNIIEFMERIKKLDQEDLEKRRHEKIKTLGKMLDNELQKNSKI